MALTPAVTQNNISLIASGSNVLMNVYIKSSS